MEDGNPIPGSLYIYAPNKVAPVFFTIAFGVSAVGHIWQCFRYKSWKLIGLHPLCAVMFTVGYATREYGAFNYLYNHHTLIVFIVSQVLIFVCPPLLELDNYHVLGRILMYVPHLAPVPADKVLSIFGGLLALVETLNSLGVSLSSNPSGKKSTQTMGGNLTLAALAIQLAVVAIFICLASIFHWRCAKANIRARAVSTPLYTLYTSMALILVRCIYRLVEHTGNTAVDLGDTDSLKDLSPVLRYEWYFYVFEASLMLINSMLWNVWHPGRYLPENKHVILAQDGTTEIQGPRTSDNRSLLAKFASTLTFGLLFRNKKSPEVQGTTAASASSSMLILRIVGFVLTFGIFFHEKKPDQRFEEFHEYPTDSPSESLWRQQK
ncbi:hypothetical protein G7046_g2874 [Stylonectria norvegica]|nr:hypothetical protein G7046_g2874 [Stylonectria norvegica]